MIKLEKIASAPAKPNPLLLKSLSALPESEILIKLQDFVDSFQYNFSGIKNDLNFKCYVVIMIITNA